MKLSGPDRRAGLRASFAMIEGRPDGAAHQMARCRAAICTGYSLLMRSVRPFLTRLSGAPMTFGALAYDDMVDQVLDGLAEHIEQHLDVEAILACARQGRSAFSSRSHPLSGGRPDAAMSAHSQNGGSRYDGWPACLVQLCCRLPHITEKVSCRR